MEKSKMKIDKTNNYGYNKKLQPIANRLRKNMTKAEACLWKYVLKARKMKGYSFRRQRPVINYIADFMCKELKLIIEVDGITHQYEETIKHDKKRQKKLEIEGFTVLRFEDSDVLNDINNVYHKIEATIDKLENQNDIPPPTPASWGQIIEAIDDRLATTCNSAN